MTIPTDPYNSPQRRPFDEGHILKPLYEEKPKAADFGHSAAKEPDAKRPDAKGQAGAGNEPTRARGRARMNDPRQAKDPAREEDPAAAPHLGTAARRRRASCSPGRRRCRPNPT